MVKSFVLFPFWFGYTACQQGFIVAIAMWPIKRQLAFAVVGGLPTIHINRT